VSGRALARRAVPAVAATAAVVALLANLRARPPAISAPADAGQAPPPPSVTVEPEVRRVSSRRPTKKGPVRSATDTSTTPFSIISVRVTLTGGELTRVETVELTGENARTQAINARAEPILREEALKAGVRGDIDAVTGATYTSRSYEKSLQAAIDRARARG
jgi:uncharacterized protein with FMN-binding domain